MFNISQTKSGTHQRRVRMEQVNPTADDKSLPHPAAYGPRIFADTGKIEDIAPLYQAGIINGVTTNPSLMKAAGAKSWDDIKRMSCEILELLNPNPVSLELTELTYDAMLEQADMLASWGDNVIIKVPVGGYQAVDPSLDPYTGLKVLNALWQRDIKTNATLIFNSTQAFWAANAGASYVSPFLGRLGDYAYQNDQVEQDPGNSLYHIDDHKNSSGKEHIYNTEYVAGGGARKDIGSRLIQEISVVFTNYDIHTEILAASFRNFTQISECLMAGADILTVPAPLLQGVADHPLTDEGMVRFVEDSKVFDSEEELVTY